MKYRIKFSKNGPIKYIGHLDVMRYFQKAIRRADLPIKYSEGFSPHQILSFAFPLSVGYTSDGEYFDMELTEEVNCEEIISRLNQEMTYGINVLKVSELPDNAVNCMSSVFAASYNARLKDKVDDIDDFADKASDYLSQSTIPVNKPKKKGGGFIEIDLKKYIYNFNVVSDREISFTVSASSEININPIFVMECVLNYIGIEYEENSIAVHRNEIYSNDGNPEEIILKSLI